MQIADIFMQLALGIKSAVSIKDVDVGVSWPYPTKWGGV